MTTGWREYRMNNQLCAPAVKYDDGKSIGFSSLSRDAVRSGSREQDMMGSDSDDWERVATKKARASV